MSPLVVVLTPTSSSIAVHLTVFTPGDHCLRQVTGNAKLGERCELCTPLLFRIVVRNGMSCCYRANCLLSWPNTMDHSPIVVYTCLSRCSLFLHAFCVYVGILGTVQSTEGRMTWNASPMIFITKRSLFLCLHSLVSSCLHTLLHTFCALACSRKGLGTRLRLHFCPIKG